MPRLVVGYDLEKDLIGQSVRASGWGEYRSFHGINADALSSTINDVWEKDALRQNCLNVSNELIARALPSADLAIAAIIRSLR